MKGRVRRTASGLAMNQHVIVRQNMDFWGIIYQLFLMSKILHVLTLTDKYTYDTPLEVSQAFGSAITGTLTTLESTSRFKMISYRSGMCWHNNLFFPCVWECTDDIQGQRKIRISKNGTLNIYIAVDISESIEKEHVDNAKEAISKLITKVKGSCAVVFIKT